MWAREQGVYRETDFPFRHCTSVRRAGNMRDPEVRAALCVSEGHPGGLVIAKQVHGTHVAVVGRADAGTQVPDCDGLVTGEKDIALGILTADCLPVFFGDTKGRAVALSHAGWRGLAGGIIGATLRLMRERFGADPADIVAAVGPHIRSCCYEVGREVLETFGRPLGETHMDLAAEAVRQLEACGVSRVLADPPCTAHNPDMFFSYRKEKTDERIMSVIRL